MDHETHSGDVPQTLTEAIQITIGHASVCWVGGTGNLVFDEGEALKCCQELEDWIKTRFELKDEFK